jgi:hypothetical protein
VTLPASAVDPEKIEKSILMFANFPDFCARLLDEVRKFERLIVQK